MKEFIKQFVPPIGMRCIRAIRGTPSAPPESEQQRALRIEFENRNRDVEFGAICLREGVTLRLHPDSRHAFEFFCYHSPAMAEELDCFIRATRDKQNLLDVGALHGIFSLVFAAHRPERRALAVDASPIAFARLLYNIHKNQATNVTPIECALSDEVGHLRMHYEWEHAVAAGTDGESHDGIVLEKTTGDSLCESRHFEPDAIKIDVEGHELKVLRGLRATIERNRPIIFLEVHPGRIHQEGHRLDELAQFISETSYRASLVSGVSIVPAQITEFVEDERLVLQPA